MRGVFSRCCGRRKRPAPRAPPGSIAAAAPGTGAALRSAAGPRPATGFEPSACGTDAQAKRACGCGGACVCACVASSASPPGSWRQRRKSRSRRQSSFLNRQPHADAAARRGAARPTEGRNEGGCWVAAATTLRVMHAVSAAPLRRPAAARRRHRRSAARGRLRRQRRWA